MGGLRHTFGLIVLVSVPIALGLWFAIHPFARAWRRIGPAGTYAVLAIPSAAVGMLIWVNRVRLLGRDLGTSPRLIALGIVAVTAAIVLSRARRRQLTQRILMGIPELSHEKGRLLTEGVYARTRNPRYIEFLLFLLGYVAVANHAGSWLLWFLCFPATHLIVLLEERELRERFGVEYDEYCRRVPRYVPRGQSTVAR